MIKKFNEFCGFYHDLNIKLLEQFNFELINEGLIKSFSYDIAIDKIEDLYPCSYVPLNIPENVKEMIDLGEFMELSPESFPEKVTFGIDNYKFVHKDKFIFDP